MSRYAKDENDNWNLIAGTGMSSDIPYDNTTSGLSATNVQDAIDEVDVNVDTNATNITNLQNNKAEQTSIAPVQTTLVASQPYPKGSQFYYNNILYEATADIASGGTITIDGNATTADDIVSQINNLAKNVDISTTRTDIFDSFNISLDFFAFAVHGKVATLSFKTISTTSLSANWNTLGTIKSQYAPCVDLSFCSYNNADGGSVQTTFRTNGTFAVWVNGAKTNYPIHTSITYILKE